MRKVGRSIPEERASTVTSGEYQTKFPTVYFFNNDSEKCVITHLLFYVQENMTDVIQSPGMSTILRNPLSSSIYGSLYLYRPQ
jgi:hypothetical protein